MMLIPLDDLRSAPLPALVRFAEALDAKLERMKGESDESYRDRLASKIQWVEEMLAENELRLQIPACRRYRGMERKKLLALAWKHTNKNFKGKYEDGTKSVLKHFGDKGTCLVPLDSLTDEELLAKIPTRFRPGYLLLNQPVGK